jgi:hypothetical protein
LRESFILDMPRFEKFSQNSKLNERNIDAKVSVKEAAVQDRDLFHHLQKIDR